MEMALEWSSASVLVASGDRRVGDFLGSLLEWDGYGVSFAVDGQDALRMVLLRWPSLIVLDLATPLRRGREFLEIRSGHPLLPGIPVLVISDGPPCGAVEGDLAKPLVPAQVLAAVHRLAGFPTQSARGMELPSPVPLTYRGGSSRSR